MSIFYLFHVTFQPLVVLAVEPAFQHQEPAFQNREPDDHGREPDDHDRNQTIDSHMCICVLKYSDDYAGYS